MPVTASAVSCNSFLPSPAPAEVLSIMAITIIATVIPLIGTLRLFAVFL